MMLLVDVAEVGVGLLFGKCVVSLALRHSFVKGESVERPDYGMFVGQRDFVVGDDEVVGG